MKRFSITLMAAAVLSSLAQAQVSNYQEQGHLIRAPRAMGQLGDNLFGDNINYYTGTINFSQTDLSLPGNNNLPMAVSRHFVAGSKISAAAHFGNWELDIPRLQGMHASKTGWDATDPNSTGTGGLPVKTLKRCSQFNTMGGATASNGDYFDLDEYWQGNFLVLPGGDRHEMLERTTGNNNIPQDGQTYQIVTKNLWAFRCLPNIANPGSQAGQGGEGFIAIAPDGTQYQFDWMVRRSMPSLSKAFNTSLIAAGSQPSPATNAGTDGKGGSVPIEPDPDLDPNLAAARTSILLRSEIWLLPSKITDRFGNTVSYNYDATDHWKLLSMVASDGRRLDFTYVAGTSQIETVSDGTRTWRYTYLPPLQNSSAPILNEVINPDNSKWSLGDISKLSGNVRYADTKAPTCETPGELLTGNLSAVLRHPSGATGTFTLAPTIHNRSQVTRDCQEVWDEAGPGLGINRSPRNFGQLSLIEKNLAGPGLPSMTWRASYLSPTASWSDCPSCADTKNTLVTDPNGDVTRYTFGTRYTVNEGMLLKTESGWNGSSALRTTTINYRSPGIASAYPAIVGHTRQRRGDAEVNNRFMPQDLRTTSQQGVTFTWQADANSFDSKARPTIIKKSSTLGYSRSEQTVFADFPAKWVLGQIASVTERNTNKVMVSNTFDPNNANILSTSHFGHLDQSMTYNADGTLATRSDGKNQTTTFSNYKRGLAQNVSYPNSTSESAVVNNIGLIDSTTDANSFTTSYGYDTAGRLSRISYPGGDSVNWADTTLTYEQVGADEFGLAPGHWRETVSTGNAKAITYLDAFWRPVLTSTYDATSQASTQRMVLNRYDYRSKPTFGSYPQRNISSINDDLKGSLTQYDALARPAFISADSELGSLNTSIIYENGFKKTVTNPRGYATSTTYQAFDEASENAIARIDQPKGISIVINRDVFGKPLGVTRSGPGSPSFTRSYVYDANQRMCKIIDPEIGATMQDYDAANNVAWRSIGLPGLLSTEMCGYSNVPAERRINYGYDSLNRLTSTSYGDGSSPGITRTYTPDGLPDTITSDGAIWKSSYNKRRLLTRESLSYNSQTYNIDHGYDSIGSMSSLTYPDGSNLDYAPNALGEISKVGKYASNISYYPNGAVAGFTYGNGIVHSMTQNLRNLPQQSIDAGILKDEYQYDKNGNVSAINDLKDATGNRSMGYDELDRLATANATLMWGNASYTYDAQDNLIQSTVGSRSITHNIDGYYNRLNSISSNNSAYNLSYVYDLQGNLVKRGNQAFVFDQANRLKSATGIASYSYDGLGRRVKIANADGSSRIQVYSAGGQLLYAVQSGGTGPTTTKYVYLRHGLIAEVSK